MTNNINQEELIEQNFLDNLPEKSKDEKGKNTTSKKSRKKKDKETEEAKPESFQAALKELKQVVNELENTQGDLDKSVAYFRRGIFLSKWAEQYLDQMEEQITEIIAENIDQ